MHVLIQAVYGINPINPHRSRTELIRKTGRLRIEKLSEQGTVIEFDEKNPLSSRR